MSDRHELHAYDYVNHSYEAVRDAILADPASVFRRATAAAAVQGDGAHGELHVKAGPFELGAAIEIEVRSIEATQAPDGRPATKLAIAWKAAQRAGLFPTMQATFSIYALGANETQLELAGTYDPPLGVVGDAIDAIAMRRIAKESVAGFVRDVATWLRTALPSHAAATASLR